MTTADRCANVAGMQQIGRLKHQGSMRRSSCRHAISHRPGDAVRAASNIACGKIPGTVVVFSPSVCIVLPSGSSSIAQPNVSAIWLFSRLRGPM